MSIAHGTGADRLVHQTCTNPDKIEIRESKEVRQVSHEPVIFDSVN